MILVTRRYRFSSSHWLNTPKLTPEENAAMFGKCNNPHGHGHNYALEVTVAGPLDPHSGLAADVALLDRVVTRSVIERLDQRDLNSEIPEFEDLVPTTENLAAVIRKWLRTAWDEALPSLHRIRIIETRNNFFEISGTP